MSNNGGGDLFDMAKEGTTVPEDAAKPRIIPSKPRPDQIASKSDPNYLGGSSLADTADNAPDIPRSTKDKATQDVLTGMGDTLPGTIGSKRLHDVPGGVVHDPTAKGSSRYEKHIRQKGGDADFGAGDGPGVERVPGTEEVGEQELMDQVERKVDL